ncbi:NAD(P)H-binding protein [Gaetbulibacter sp. M235]|uniref:NAD(P)H-binding protein n=1 Tax=Gaetbulibacter sp. M235 TaxID=3126510 RepID=UPI00374F5406
MSKTAIIIGATGLTGSILVQKLLDDKRYKTIKLLSRTSCNIAHSKIKEHLINLFELEKYEDLFIADEVFCCIGTTKAKTPDEATYLKIDYGIPVSLAQICVKRGIKTFIVISALGANKKSKLFYNRTKGKMEEDVLREKIMNTYILQPSLITGNRTEKRSSEKIGKIFMTVLNPLLLGSLKKYRSIQAKTIVNAMIWLANNNYKSGRILSNEIQKISDKL